MTPMSRGREAGFTLMELLVIILIIGLVMSMGASSFVRITQVWNEGRVIAELNDEAKSALESIRKDLASAVSSDVSGLGLTGASREVKDGRTYPAGTHADDDLSFTIEMADTAHGGTGLAAVGYHVERNGPTGTLVRTVGPISGGFPAGGRIEIIAARVQGFSVDYLGRGPGAAWSETWAGPGFPSAVRVSIALENSVRREFESSRKAVIPIYVH